MDRSSKFPVTSLSDYLCYSCPNFNWQMHILVTNWRTSFICKRKKCHANFWYNCFLSALCAVFGKLFFLFVFRKSFPSCNLSMRPSWGEDGGGQNGYERLTSFILRSIRDKHFWRAVMNAFINKSSLEKMACNSRCSVMSLLRACEIGNVKAANLQKYFFVNFF